MNTIKSTFLFYTKPKKQKQKTKKEKITKKKLSSKIPQRCGKSSNYSFPCPLAGSCSFCRLQYDRRMPPHDSPPPRGTRRMGAAALLPPLAPLQVLVVPRVGGSVPVVLGAVLVVLVVVGVQLLQCWKLFLCWGVWRFVVLHHNHV